MRDDARQFRALLRGATQMRPDVDSFRAPMPQVKPRLLPPTVRTFDEEFDGPPAVAFRRYLPETVAGPLVLFLHGGAWVRGSSQMSDVVGVELASRGLEVVAPDYALAPEEPFPAALDQCTALLDALHESEGARPLVVMGDSAGGTFTAALAARRPRSMALHVVMSAPLDMTGPPTKHEPTVGADIYRDHAIWEWIVAQYLPDPARRTDPDASPLLRRSHAGLPPGLMVIGGEDPFADQMRRHAAQVAGAGVDMEILEYPELPHGFLSTGFPFDDAQGCLDTLADRCFRTTTSVHL